MALHLLNLLNHYLLLYMHFWYKIKPGLKFISKMLITTIVDSYLFLNSKLYFLLFFFGRTTYDKIFLICLENLSSSFFQMSTSPFSAESRSAYSAGSILLHSPEPLLRSKSIQEHTIHDPIVSVSQDSPTTGENCAYDCVLTSEIFNTF